MTLVDSAQPMSPWLEQAWLRRYLDGDLSDEEVEFFEIYCISKPALLEAIDVDTSLRAAFKREPAAGLSIAFGSKTAARPLTPAQSVSRPFVTRWLPLAASLMLGVGAGLLATKWERGGNDSLVSNPTRVVFETFRSADSNASVQGGMTSKVDHGGEGSPIVLVEIAVPPGATDIVLRVPDSPELKLTNSRDGFVSFVLQRKQILKGTMATLRYLDGKEVITKSIQLNSTIIGG